MNNTARISEVTDLSIEIIKKAFIKRHQFEAANEQPISMAATNNHIESVRRWIAPLEFDLKIKAVVISCASPGMNEDASAQVVDGTLFVLANGISCHQQARNVFVYGAIGLILIPGYLKKYSDTVIDQIFRGLSDDQLESMSLLHEQGVDGTLSDESKRALIEMYLADLAVLNVTPSFTERRDSWQRSFLRKALPNLIWTSNDLHYLVHRAKCSI